MATGKRLRYDGVEVYLDGELSAGATTINFSRRLEHDGGAPVQTVGKGTEYLVLSILDSNYRLLEIVHLTEYALDATSGTVERGMEGTTARVHADGNKVIHAPTAEDFIAIQDHIDDPNAHSDEITAICNGLIAAAIANHKNPSLDGDPHPIYILKYEASTANHAAIVPNGAIVPDGKTLTVSPGAYLRVESGGKLIVEGELEIKSSGKITINGRQLVISNTMPTSPPSNVVWIQTFGA